MAISTTCSASAISIPFAILIALLLPAASSAVDIQSPFIYKGCANQTFSSYSFPGSTLSSDVWEQAIASLSSALLTKATSGALFYKTSVSGVPTPLSGLYQCRGDLSKTDCANCVARAPPLWSSLCGPAVAVRVQLQGCYALYQVQGFPQTAGTKMLYKWCSSATSSGERFQEQRDTAFANIQARAAALAPGGARTGFYSTEFEGGTVIAQCEADLSAGDCGECVSEAVQKAEVECGRASAVQMYLDKCYVIYGDGGPSGGGGEVPEEGKGYYILNVPESTQKTAAIVIGGAAVFGLLIVLFLFFVSAYKNPESRR